MLVRSRSVLAFALALSSAGCAPAPASEPFAPTLLCAGTLEGCARGAEGLAFELFSEKRQAVRGAVDDARATETAVGAMPRPEAASFEIDGDNLAFRAAILRADGALVPLGAAFGRVLVGSLAAPVAPGDRFVIEVTRHAPASWMGLPRARFGVAADLEAGRLERAAVLVLVVGWLFFAAATQLADTFVGRDRRAAGNLALLAIVIAVRDAIFLRGAAERWSLLPPEASLRAEYATVGLIGMAAVAFCREVTKENAEARVLGRVARVVAIAAGMTAALCFALPTVASLRVAQVGGAAAIATVAVLTTAARSRIPRREWLALVAGFGACSLGAIVDIVANVRERALFLGTGFVVFGTAIMVFAHGLVLAFRAAATHDRAERLAVDVRDASEAVIREHERTNESLVRLDRMKDEFLANTSHELRTPLNGILGLVEATLEGAQGEVAPGIARNLELVHGSARRLASLVSDILDFSKLKQHEVTLRTSSVDVRALVDIVVRSLDPLARDKDLALVNAVDEGLRAEADGDRVQQILTNLLGNGLKFTERGSVRVESHVRDGRVFLAVRDTGIGIPADAFGRIFESFEQGDGSTERTYGGTGLGLAITRKLVELHGGAIRVESEVGVGSVFTFDLQASAASLRGLAPAPVASAGAGAQLHAMPHASVPPLSQPVSSGARFPSLPPSMRFRAQGVRVLVVDDEPVNREVLAQHLAHQGYEVLLARDGDEALALLGGEGRPDLVVLDVMMPRRSGYEVLERIRSDAETSGLPVILLTARAMPEDLAKGFELGANDYLTKPVSLVELEARVGHQGRLLSAQRALAAHAESLEETVARRTEDLNVALARITSMHEALKVKDEDRTRDLEEARRFQERMVPASDEVGGFPVARAFWPAAEVGGDFLDVRAMGPGWIRIFVADATGHGVQAALRAMVVKTIYDAACAPEVAPGELLGAVNRALVDAYPDLEAKVDAACADLREEEGAWHLVAAQAGGVAVGVSGLGEHGAHFDEVRCKGLPLGVDVVAVYEPVAQEVAAGALVAVMSDGILEQQDAAGQRFEWEGVTAALASPLAYGAPAGAVLAVETAWRAHRGDVPQDDDATLVIVVTTRAS